MSAAVKTVFIRIRGRIVPIRKNVKGAPDDVQKIEHIRRSRKALREEPTIPGKNINRKFHAVFHKIAVQQAKETGFKASKRIAKLKKKKAG